MMLKRKAFTLLELLIALALSSILLLALSRSLRQISHVFTRANWRISVERRAVLILHQLERDLTAACIPKLAQLLDAKDTKQRKKKSLILFRATSDKEEIRRIGKRRHELLKWLNFITTTPLTQYGQKKRRLLRVGYSVEVDKRLRRRGIDSYSLIRRETTEIPNEKFDVVPPHGKVKPVPVFKHVIADNIQGIFIEFTSPKKKQDKNDKKARKVFSWGKRKETKNVLPTYATIHLLLWDDTHTRGYMFSSMIPFLSKGKLPSQQAEKPVAAAGKGGKGAAVGAAAVAK